MAAQAHALTRALKGNAKVRGDWGELMLESVLRGSGLEEGVHFERQKHVAMKIEDFLFFHCPVVFSRLSKDWPDYPNVPPWHR